MKKIILSLVFCLSIILAQGQTAGPQYPGTTGTAALTGSTVVWATPANIATDNGVYASAAIPKNAWTNFLVGRNFGFAIPAGATILGITVDVEKYSADTKTFDYQMNLTKDGSTAIGTNLADVTKWPSAAAVTTYGGAANLWGATWTVAEINSANFGVLLSANQTATGTVSCYVDYIRVTVTYSAGSGPCLSATAMTCGTTYSNTLLSTGSDWSTYTSCSYSEPGDEKVYSFTPTVSCDYTFTTTTTSGDPDFFLMSTCGTSGTNLTGGCWSSGNETVALTAGVPYYLIVDNYSSSASAGYTVSVGCPCSGTPNAGTVSASVSPVSCAAPSSVLTATGLSTGCGTTYQWQSGPATGGPWTNISGATGTTTTVSPIVNTYYHIVTTCANGGGTNSSPSVQVKSNITPPANDECAGAIVLTVNPDQLCGTVTAGTTLCATNSGIAACVGSGADDDVWFKFVATNSSLNVDITNVSGSTDCVHEIFSGTCPGGLSSIACSDPESSEWTGLTVGQTYYIRVYTYFTSASSDFNICLGTPPPPPSNDEPCGAIPLNVNYGSCSFQSSVLETSATISTGMPAPGCGSLGPDVWFTAVVPASGRLIVDIQSASGPTDFDMAWYTGTSCSNVNTLIECDDYDSQNGSMSMICRTGTLCTVPGDCQQNATITPGQTIYVRVWEYGGGTFGPFDICAYEPQAPGAASTCASATTIASLPYADNGQTTCCRGNEIVAVDGCASTYQGGEDYLYKYTPSTNQVVDIMLTGTLTYSGVFVTNKCPTAGGVACVGSATSTTGNPMICGLSLNSGTTYYIMIDTQPGPTCTPFNLTMTSSSSPTCGLNYSASSISYSADLNNGTSIALPVDDRFSSSFIPIGFPFCFDGYQFTQLLVSSNGYVLFDPISCASNLPTTNAAPGGTSDWKIELAIPNSTDAPRNCIMFPWQDIYPSLGGTIKYQVLGTAPYRRFVLTFANVPYFDCTTIFFTGQLKLFETTNNIEVHLDNKEICTTWPTAPSGLGILGLHNYNGTIAVVPSGGYNYSTQWDANNEAWLFTCNCVGCIVLPVEYLSFTGELIEPGINYLKWETATETDNHHFEIERKTEETDFVKIAQQQGAGNSNEVIHYSYTDNEAPEGLCYYRLKQVDNNGKETYSSVIAIGAVPEMIEFIKVFPNPATEEISIRFSSDGTPFRIVLVAAGGQEFVLNESVSYYGATTLSFQLHQIPAGVYMLKADNEKNEYFFKEKIIIQ